MSKCILKFRDNFKSETHEKLLNGPLLKRQNKKTLNTDRIKHLEQYCFVLFSKGGNFGSLKQFGSFLKEVL